MDNSYQLSIFTLRKMASALSPLAMDRLARHITNEPVARTVEEFSVDNVELVDQAAKAAWGDIEDFDICKPTDFISFQFAGACNGVCIHEFREYQSGHGLLCRVRPISALTSPSLRVQSVRPKFRKAAIRPATDEH